jgi:hypothetical protein
MPADTHRRDLPGGLCMALLESAVPAGPAPPSGHAAVSSAAWTRPRGQRCAERSIQPGQDVGSIASRREGKQVRIKRMSSGRNPHARLFTAPAVLEVRAGDADRRAAGGCRRAAAWPGVRYPIPARQEARGCQGGAFPLPSCRPFRATGIRWPCPFRCPSPAQRLTSTGRASLRTRASVLIAARVRWWARLMQPS